MLQLIRRSVLSAVLILASLALAQAAHVALEWDRNQETDLAGYKLFIATFSLLNVSTAEATNDSRVQRIEIGLSTPTIDVPINAGVTNYFRLLAFDQSHNESGFNIKLSTGGQSLEDEVNVFFSRADSNSDGRVNFIDFGILLKEWAQ